jgi:hypothetical protein
MPLPLSSDASCSPGMNRTSFNLERLDDGTELAIRRRRSGGVVRCVREVAGEHHEIGLLRQSVDGRPTALRSVPLASGIDPAPSNPQ